MSLGQHTHHDGVLSQVDLCCTVLWQCIVPPQHWPLYTRVYRMLCRPCTGWHELSNHTDQPEWYVEAVPAVPD